MGRDPVSRLHGPTPSCKPGLNLLLVEMPSLFNHVQSAARSTSALLLGTYEEENKHETEVRQQEHEEQHNKQRV